jgi:hypothetical protein
MDLESITLYLSRKHLSTLENRSEMNNVLGQGTGG